MKEAGAGSGGREGKGSEWKRKRKRERWVNVTGRQRARNIVKQQITRCA